MSWSVQHAPQAYTHAMSMETARYIDTLTTKGKQTLQSCLVASLTSNTFNLRFNILEIRMFHEIT